MTDALILASGSAIRQQLLRQSGVPFEVQIARVDEDMIKASLVAEGVSPRDIADQLAEAKARKVAMKHPGRVVLGCDQILSCDDGILSKPVSQSDAQAQLAQLAGKKHRLISAAVIYDEGKPVWRKIGVVTLHMHRPSVDYLDSYVSRNWDSIQHSVGGYKIEEEGARLFHKIDGDYFHVLGMPLLEVLGYLTLRGMIEG